MNEVFSIKELIKYNFLIVIIMVGLVITHELGHWTTYLMLGTRYEFFLMEEGIYNKASFGLVIGFTRYDSYDILTEFYMCILAPLIMNIMFLLVGKKLNFYEIIPMKIWLLVLPLLASGDIYMFIDRFLIKL